MEDRDFFGRKQVLLFGSILIGIIALFYFIGDLQSVSLESVSEERMRIRDQIACEPGVLSRGLLESRQYAHESVSVVLNFSDPYSSEVLEYVTENGVLIEGADELRIWGSVPVANLCIFAGMPGVVNIQLAEA